MAQRTTVNYLVDVVAFVSFALLAATGLVERYMLPPGTGRFQALWGMDRHQWGEIHFWIAMVLMGTLAVHLFLHWKWIVCVTGGRPSEASGTRLGLGLLGVVGVIGLSLAPFLSTVEQTGNPGRRQNSESHQPASVRVEGGFQGEIRGSMTLEEIDETTGVSAELIVEQLSLPSDIPRDEQLGRLRRQYGFEMSEVRRIVEEHSSQSEVSGGRPVE